MFFLVMSALTLMVPLFAQDEFEEVRVLDHPRYSLTRRLSFDADFNFLPLDAYFKPLLAEVSASYQPADWFSWEIARFGYSLVNIDTGLEGSMNVLAAPKQVDERDLKLKDMKYHASSTGFFNLLYSKSNFFNQGITYYYWQIGSGVSYFSMKGGSQIGMDLGIRVRFFLNDHFNLTLRGGQTVGFKSGLPKNIMFMGLGVGFAI
jgi:hypothetical protein